MVRALIMSLLKGYFNDFILLKSKICNDRNEQLAELAMQITGADEGKLFRLEASEVKAELAVDYVSYDELSYNVFPFTSAEQEKIDKSAAYYLNNKAYHFLLTHDKEGKIVHHCLGKGTFGRVYSALDSQHNLVAIKLFKKHTPWQDELNNTNRLKQINAAQGILLPLDYGETEEGYSIVYPQGINASYKMGLLNTGQLLDNIKQLAMGLACLHQHGLYHGDIKLDNIVFTQQGLAFIDFGMLKEALAYIHNITYCCPDMLTDQIDFKIEVLALGVCFYRMFVFNVLSQQGPVTYEDLSLTYQKQQMSTQSNRINPNDWRPPAHWRSPYIATFEELELLQQGVFSRPFLPHQRPILNGVFQLIKEMLSVNSQHRPSSDDILHRIQNLQGSFS